MSESSQNEKRWSDRRDICTDVKVILNHRSYYARTHDIGLGGMFVDLNYVLLPMHTTVEIVMLKYKSAGKYISFKTRVAYVTPHGYGLEFQDFSIRDVHRLQDVLFESPYEVVRMA